MFDYETLKLIWWLLIGILLIGFAIMDGHDMGVGILLPFAGRTDDERRVIINSIGPHWEGNQVWLLTGGGAIFAAWPLVYATAFSGFYWAMLAALWSLFFRPVAFDYRSKVQHPAWRGAWDWLLFLGSAIPPVIFGVAFGNLLQGVPFYFDENLRSVYTGTFWQLLNPFGLLAGMISFSMLTCHGANYLMLRSTDAIYRRARLASQIFGMLTFVAFALAGYWVMVHIDGYFIASALDPGASPDPLNKSVVVASGAWTHNYMNHSWIIAVPFVAFSALLLSVLFSRNQKAGAAFIASSFACAGIIATAGVSMFPFVLPSSYDPSSSLTVWDSTSSRLTLSLMLVTTLIFMPLIIFYTSWAYRVMRGKITTGHIKANDRSVY